MDKKNILQMDIKDLFKGNIKVNPKNVIILVVILLGLISYGYFILYPKYIKFSQVSNDLDNANMQLTKDEDELGEIPKLKDELHNISEEVDVKSKKLSHDMQDGMFLVGLSNIMNKYNVDLIDYNVDKMIKFENFNAIPATLKVRGNYRYIREIMYYLEEQKNVTQIQNFNMESYIKNENINFNDVDSSNNNLNPTDIKPYQENKAKGDVTATFKFIMYMVQDPNLKLNLENPNNWKTGKFNPFVDTTN